MELTKKKNESEDEKIDRQVLCLIVRKNLAFSFVNSPEFIDIMKKAYPQYKVIKNSNKKIC